MSSFWNSIASSFMAITAVLPAPLAGPAPPSAPGACVAARSTSFSTFASSVEIDSCSAFCASWGSARAAAAAPSVAGAAAAGAAAGAAAAGSAASAARGMDAEAAVRPAPPAKPTDGAGLDTAAAAAASAGGAGAAAGAGAGAGRTVAIWKARERRSRVRGTL